MPRHNKEGLAALHKDIASGVAEKQRKEGASAQTLANKYGVHPATIERLIKKTPPPSANIDNSDNTRSREYEFKREGARALALCGKW